MTRSNLLAAAAICAAPVDRTMWSAPGRRASASLPKKRVDKVNAMPIPLLLP